MTRAEPSPRVLAYLFESPGPAWTIPFLATVGRRLARAPVGSGLFIEQSLGTNDPFLAPGTPLVRRFLEESAAEWPGRLRRTSVESTSRPTGLGTTAGLVLRPGEPARTRRPPTFGREEQRSRPTDLPREPAPESPGLLPLLGLGAWAATQSHWISTGEGELLVWLRAAVAGDSAGRDLNVESFGAALALHLERAADVSVRPENIRWTRSAAREWESGALRRFRASAGFRLAPTEAARASTHRSSLPGAADESLGQQTIVLGASGSGKTSYLASVTRRWVEAGRPAVVVDVHGDLAPSIVTALAPSARARVVAIDATEPAHRIPGLALLSDPGSRGAEREAATLVAALKRLSAEGGELHWGFRLERILDVFVRLAQEEGGSLRELHALLTDPYRREAARWTTRRPEAARLLEELPAILRRNPEFLWSAAVRVSKVALVPSVAALVAPPGESLPLEGLLDDGRSVFWHLPIGQLGPEATGFVANLLVSRLFFHAASRQRPGPRGGEVLLVIDEAQLLAPHLLVDVVAEGRKFGVWVLLATQYPERFSPELRAAAAGAAGTHVVFRVAPAAARIAGGWLGLTPEEAARWLPALPSGHGLCSTTGSGLDRRLIASEELAPGDCRLWAARVEATLSEFSETLSGSEEGPRTHAVEEAILLETLGLGARGVRPGGQQVVEGAARHAGERLDAAVVAQEVRHLVERGWLTESAGTLSLSTAGARFLGMSPDTQAPTESAEHRALLLEAFRVFARQGERLEILRQGRFDTRLPDARLRLLSPAALTSTPAEIAARIEERMASWAWRLAHGRDIHVEAEVSGASRPARIRRGVDKARAHHAFLVFLVGDAGRARRVRVILANAEVDRTEAQVWTLPAGAFARP